MTPAQLSALLVELLSLPHETEWVEWKHNNDNPEMIAERISALANSTALQGREFGYMVWGVEDGTKKIVGTSFRPRQSKKGNEELENWLMRSLHPQVNFQMYEWSHQGVLMVLAQVPRASQAPVRFVSEEYIRIGSLTKKLKDYTEKEGELWAIFARRPFETGIAKSDVDGPDVLKLLDFDRCFKLLQIPLPTDQQGILSKLADEALTVPKPGGRFDITNLGAILIATDLNKFERLGRKALRIIKYRGDGRTHTEREWRDAPTQMGYAVAYEAAVAFINSQLPQNEPIGQAFRQEVRVYPEKAIRELVAN
jgi:ATP-dependent DNA helicase RecG